MPKKKCEICNKEIRRDGMDNHLKTKGHLKKLEEYEKNLMANAELKTI